MKVNLPVGLRQILGKLRQKIEPERRREISSSTLLPAACPSCGMPTTSVSTSEEILTHNPRTCGLVNLVLKEMGVVFEHQVRVEIYQGVGPLGGFYATVDPYTIHVSDDAYTRFPEYIIFHETKHLVDCLTKGWSEEGTPDQFARAMCFKYGYRWPPAQHPLIFSGTVFSELTP